MEEKKEVSFKDIAKLVLRTGALIGAGAVAGCCLRNQDLSGLKGIGKVCAGLGIIGISHAVGNAAADAIDKDVDNVCGFIGELSAMTDTEEEKSESNVVEFAAT